MVQMGIYESIASSAGSGTWEPRLQAIASNGFSYVLNYGLLLGHTSDMLAYIDYAASLGLQVIVAVENSVIWDTVAYPTNSALVAEYPSMYADAGSPTSNWSQVFGQYVVNQVKGHAGTWGYYIGDEVVASQHTALLSYAGYIHSADSSKPRLIVCVGTGGNSCSDGTSVFSDCCEVTGDDYYPIGRPLAYSKTTAQIATGIQSYCTTHSLLSTMVLQAFQWPDYTGGDAFWPSRPQMVQSRSDALANMSPDLILWYSFAQIESSDNPSQFLADLAYAANGVGNSAKWRGF